MKSISCLASVGVSLPIQQDQTSVATAFDPSSGFVYVASETSGSSGSVQIDLFVIEGSQVGQTRLLSTYFSQTSSAVLADDSSKPAILSLKFLADSDTICIILRGGDIVTLALANEDLEPQFETVGIVDAGICAASWSPDEELIVLITGDDKLLQMTTDFDTLYDTALRSSEFGEEAQINVGWGSKETQFHGSAGKSAAASAAEQAAVAARGSSSPDDDLDPRVSWRGDGAFFVVSTLDRTTADKNRRVLRIYNRSVNLQSTSEPVPGLEHPLAWRPSGNLIASSQRFGFEGGGEGRDGRHDIVMFEKNGLRHGEFQLRETFVEKSQRDVRKEKLAWGYRVQDLSWNSDSTILAVWLRRNTEDVVQLWTMNNYHWYLKQELKCLEPSKRYTSVLWHPEEPLKLAVLSSSSLNIMSFSWDTYISQTSASPDNGVVGVVDGSSLLITSFKVQNVPPPYSSTKISTIAKLPPAAVSFSPTRDDIAMLFTSGSVEVWNVLIQPHIGAGKKVTGVPAFSVQLPSNCHGRQIALGHSCATDYLLGVLGRDTETGQDAIWICQRSVSDADPIAHVKWEVEYLPLAGAGRFVALNPFGLLFQNRKGELLQVSVANEEFTFDPLPTSFPTFCPQIQSCKHLNGTLIAGQSSQGKLFTTTDTAQEIYEVATDCTSFALSAEHLIYTTTSHISKYVTLDVLRKILEGYSVQEAEKEWETRRVERGSCLVTVVPSAMGLVLQMPRGNLETVNPRPLVLSQVRVDLNLLNYRAAFIACRKHRFDLNILYDYNPGVFMENLSAFVSQLETPEYLNLFISGLRDEDVTETIYRQPGTVQATNLGQLSKHKVNKVCDAIRAELEKIDLVKYVDSILTTHVVKNPPDYEEALRLLHTLKGQHPNAVEDAIKYVIFLADANKLFNVALGMYDFQLVLMIAQYSQKDPREYLPFLRELQSLDKYYQRFKIDDHLEKYSCALTNLHLAGSNHYDETIDYIERHNLYVQAVSCYKDDPEILKTIYGLYGEHLYDRRDFNNSALAFILSGNSPRAMKAYEKAHAWRELFTLAITEKLPVDQLSALCDKVAGHLTARGRFSEAGRLWIDYGKNIDEGAAVLTRGREFSEAIRIVTLNDRTDLIESLVHPSLEDTAAAVHEDLTEIEEQLDKQVFRLQELAILKREKPDAFFMEEDPALENIDVMTDATQATAFTRYTVAPTTVYSAMTGMTGMSKVSAKSKRKKSMKQAAGRKGTVNEESYLLGSLNKLIDRFKLVVSDSQSLLAHLLLATEYHREQGRELKIAFDNLEKKITAGVEQAWEGQEPPKPVEVEGIPLTEKPVKPTLVFEHSSGLLGT